MKNNENIHCRIFLYFLLTISSKTLVVTYVYFNRRCCMHKRSHKLVVVHFGNNVIVSIQLVSHLFSHNNFDTYYSVLSCF